MVITCTDSSAAGRKCFPHARIQTVAVIATADDSLSAVISLPSKDALKSLHRNHPKKPMACCNALIIKSRCSAVFS
jgi:hypothetical protein